MSIYERIVHGAPDAIVLANADGKIELWSPGAERLFGFSQEEALGQSLDLIVPEKQRERHWAGFHEVMRTGRSHYGPHQIFHVPALKKDGTRFSISFTVGLVKGTSGQVGGIFAILRDDTEAFNTQKALRDRIKELEQALEQAKIQG